MSPSHLFHCGHFSWGRVEFPCDRTLSWRYTRWHYHGNVGRVGRSEGGSEAGPVHPSVPEGLKVKQAYHGPKTSPYLSRQICNIWREPAICGNRGGGGGGRCRG